VFAPLLKATIELRTMAAATNNPPATVAERPTPRPPAIRLAFVVYIGAVVFLLVGANCWAQVAAPRPPHNFCTLLIARRAMHSAVLRPLTQQLTRAESLTARAFLRRRG